MRDALAHGQALEAPRSGQISRPSLVAQGGAAVESVPQARLAALQPRALQPRALQPRALQPRALQPLVEALQPVLQRVELRDRIEIRLEPGRAARSPPRTWSRFEFGLGLGLGLGL